MMDENSGDIAPADSGGRKIMLEHRTVEHTRSWGEFSWRKAGVSSLAVEGEFFPRVQQVKEMTIAPGQTMALLLPTSYRSAESVENPRRGERIDLANYYDNIIGQSPSGRQAAQSANGALAVAREGIVLRKLPAVSDG